MRMNNRSIQLFKEAMKDGKAKVYNIRVMVVGHLGVGKTTLIKRFLEKEVNINKRQSTEGIIVHVHCCKVSHDGLKWTINEGDSEQNLRLQRLAQVLNDQVQKRKLTEKRVEQVEIICQREGNGRVIEIIYQREKKIMQVTMSSICNLLVRTFKLALTQIKFHQIKALNKV